MRKQYPPSKETISQSFDDIKPFYMYIYDDEIVETYVLNSLFLPFSFTCFFVVVCRN